MDDIEHGKYSQNKHQILWREIIVLIYNTKGLTQTKSNDFVYRIFYYTITDKCDHCDHTISMLILVNGQNDLFVNYILINIEQIDSLVLFRGM